MNNENSTSMTTNDSTSEQPPAYPPGSLQEFFDNTPEKWIKFAYARNKNGEDISGLINSQMINNGVCFCLLGGIRKVFKVDDDISNKTQEVRDKIVTAIEKLFPRRPSSIHVFNDHPETTFEDRKKVLKEANV